ncbi:fibronectin type-III domain-containing protein 3A isoform X2 [Bemisia tabaci]|uniref:fibronectin type-III domain-containing protein 3A isoform X2 n=1 Tax=Bemisia tabaci TaxID=7038 RepID=UPI0008F9B73C|nr:PREDICTED: fibronectin type-III domain-containing protein 3A isoform X2 [Bemisia tabaci]
MVAGQPVVEASQHYPLSPSAQNNNNNDAMFCSAMPASASPQYEYYQPQPEYHQYASNGQQGSPDLCPAHTQLCTVHGDYGPVTVPMVSTNSSPPIAMPVQVPHGHVVQQIVDESGTLRHVILSPQHPPMVPIPPHFGAGSATGSNQAPQPFFNPQGMGAGYHHFGHGTPLQPGVLSHVPPHQGHSPPPGHTFHKDERTQRQYIKLKKKFEQKQFRSVISHVTPPLTPRKELVNGLRSGRKGVSSVGTSEDGEESSSAQDEDDLIAELLANIRPPTVAEISSRFALIQWWPPEGKSPELDISESDFRYEVLLSDKGRDGKYKTIYSGGALSCRVQDLRPVTDYAVCVQVHFEELAGLASEPTLFTTPPCEPDAPYPPKLVSRLRNGLQLKWFAANDNGSRILQYILECDQGCGEFVEIFKNKNKTFNYKPLTPSTFYKFRLAAVNEYGKSKYSDIVVYATAGSPPSQPAPPQLLEQGVDSLRLGWGHRPEDEDYILQMNDPATEYGFLHVYNGKDTQYCCTNLHRYTSYKFRLRAHNEEGISRWSEEVSYSTLPGRPSQPPRPHVKGRVRAHNFNIKWDPPADTGGASITNYHLEMNSGNGYQVIYSGPDNECNLDGLEPGSTYLLRVSCESKGGRSIASEPLSVLTESVCPGRCSPPRLHAKPRPYSIHLKWNLPEKDGGSPITHIELKVSESGDEASERIAYQGLDSETLVTDLSPGTQYVFQLRAVNKVGKGPWSDPLEVTSGAVAPEPPNPVDIEWNGLVAHCSWEPPRCNGAPIVDYKLELAQGDTMSFSQVYKGAATSADVHHIPPASLCHFRIQASNTAGWSNPSEVRSVSSPPSVPAVVPQLRCTATISSLRLHWGVPVSNGEPITHYTVDVSPLREPWDTPDTECVVDDLTPATSFKVRVRAVNKLGAGPWSPILKTATLPLPPSPPLLKCVHPAHNYLKLKWSCEPSTTRSTNQMKYTLVMQNPQRPDVDIEVYSGPKDSYKVSRLQEQTTYKFAISAANDAGQGPLSSYYSFSTSTAPPSPLKAPRVSEVTSDGCTVEWTPARPMGAGCDPLSYCLQISRLRDQQFNQVYRGDENRTRVSGLESNVDYLLRVCAIRRAPKGKLQGPFSATTSFSTLPALDNSYNSQSSKQANLQVNVRHHLSDQQWALIILSGFLVFAVVVACIVQQIIY